MNSENVNQRGTVIAAALLHDISKFHQRAGGKGRHPELTAKFNESMPLPPSIDWRVLVNVASHRHTPDPYPVELRPITLAGAEKEMTKLVSEADNKRLVKDTFKNYKHLGKPPHTHNPIDDTRRNAEALLTMEKEYGLSIRKK